MKYLYKYPQRKFPYQDLVAENARRGKTDKEYQLADTGVFDDNRYWDIFIEIAKEDEDELLFRATAWNRGPEPAPLHIVPHVWFRNTWSWGREPASKKPIIRQIAPLTAQSKHWKLGDRFFQLSPSPAVGESDQDIQPQMIFTENDTNYKSLYGGVNAQPYVKDAFHRLIVDGERGAINLVVAGRKALRGLRSMKVTAWPHRTVRSCVSASRRNIRDTSMRSSLTTSSNNDGEKPMNSSGVSARFQ